MSEQFIELDPKSIQVIPEDNPRYGAPFDIASLKDAIQSEGGVNTPVEVEALPSPVNGFHYRMTVGFRRHQAVSELNAAGAGLKLPAIVRERADSLTRLKTQISENYDRRNLSPMDLAVAIKKLFAAGQSRIQIREMFPRANSQSKDAAIAPASNAWVNMMVSFLTLPPDIQERIHDGRLPVKAAYTLTRVPPEKRADVLKRAEQDAIDEAKKEEADEAKFIKAQSEVERLSKEEQEVVIKADTIQAEVELAEKAVDVATKAAGDAYKTFQEQSAKAVNLKAKGDSEGAKVAMDAAKKASEHFKASETDVKSAQKLLGQSQRELEKTETARKKVADAAAVMRESLEAARTVKPKAASKSGATVSSKGVAEAAAAEGSPAGVVPLNVTEIRKFVAELALMEAQYPKVAQIGQILTTLFKGTGLPQGTAFAQATKKLAVVTGEITPKVKAAPVAPKAPPTAPQPKKK